MSDSTGAHDSAPENPQLRTPTGGADAGRHREVVVEVLPGRTILVDEGLAALVAALWRLGVETVTSCQGGPAEVGYIYVTARTAELCELAFLLRTYRAAVAAAGWAFDADAPLAEVYDALDAIPRGVSWRFHSYPDVLNGGTVNARVFVFHPAEIDGLTAAARRLTDATAGEWELVLAGLDDDAQLAVVNSLHSGPWGGWVL